MSFVFIPYGSQLDKKKTELLSEKIRKNGGMTFRVDFFDWKPPSYVELFIIVNKEMAFQVTFYFHKTKR